MLLALGPRDTATPGAEQAARHLKSRLDAAGVPSQLEEFQDVTPAGTATLRNVIGRLGGGPSLIIIGSHYDTKSGIEGFVGANDSGSSSGALIELARALAEQVPDGWSGPEIRFVFFDGEEAMVNYGPHDGLHGSRHHAAQLRETGRADDVLGVIVLDMIGDRDLTITLPRNGTPFLTTAVLQAAQQEGARSKFSLFAYGIGDDHESFLQLGMPAVDIIDFQFGSAPGLNDYWHTPEDTLDKLSAESLEIVGRVTIRVINDLLRRHPLPPPRS